VCVGRTTRTDGFPRHNNSPRHLPAGWLWSCVGSGRVGPPHRVAPALHPRLPRPAHVGEPPTVRPAPRKTGESLAARPVSQPPGRRKVHGPARRTPRVSVHRAGSNSQRGAVAKPIHSRRQLPRIRRTLSPVNNRRSVTVGGRRDSGTEREGCAVQQADQADGPRRHGPCVRKARAATARSLSPTLDRSKPFTHQGRHPCPQPLLNVVTVASPWTPA